MPWATATLRLLAEPAIGMATVASARSRRPRDRPVRSLPSSRRAGRRQRGRAVEHDVAVLVGGVHGEVRRRRPPAVEPARRAPRGSAPATTGSAKSDPTLARIVRGS